MNKNDLRTEFVRRSTERIITHVMQDWDLETARLPLICEICAYSTNSPSDIGMHYIAHSLEDGFSPDDVVDHLDADEYFDRNEYLMKTGGAGYE